MDSSFIFSSFFSNISPEVLMFLEFGVCGGLLLFANRFFGLSGLYVYTGAGVVAANMAVLKTVQFSFYPEPMALGTIIFSSLFLCSDMINERYGKEAALKSVWLGFFSYFTLMLFMFFSLGYQNSFSDGFQAAASFLFLPAPALFIASLTAYFLGQYVDVFLYHFIHTKTGKKYLWLRSSASTLLAMFIDNAIFSFLAWGILAVNPMPFSDIFWTYVFGVTLVRAVVSVGNIGFMYIFSFLNRKVKINVVPLS